MSNNGWTSDAYYGAGDINKRTYAHRMSVAARGAILRQFRAERAARAPRHGRSEPGDGMITWRTDGA